MPTLQATGAMDLVARQLAEQCIVPFNVSSACRKFSAGKGRIPPPLGCQTTYRVGARAVLSGGRTLCAGGQQLNSGMDLHDPVWHYATRCRWQGIALEPVNSTFQRLQNSYAPFPRVQPVRAAVSDRAGAQEMVTGIGWSGEAARFVWNARAQKWRAGRRPKDCPKSDKVYRHA